MADERQLHILLGLGVYKWNQSRAKSPAVAIDLSQGDFRNRNLSGADLSGARIHGANLSWANLRRVDLTNADLRNAILVGADLTNGILTGANLHRVDLSDAKLTQADLRGANLGEAKLTWADLNGADLSGANLAGADLSGAKLIKADLIGTELNMAQLVGADLREAKLDPARLIGVDLSAADIRGTILDTESDPDAAVEWTELGNPVELELRRVIEDLHKDELNQLRDKLNAKLDAQLFQLRQRVALESKEDFEAWLAKQLEGQRNVIRRDIREWEKGYSLRYWGVAQERAIELLVLQYQQQYHWDQLQTEQLKMQIERQFGSFIFDEIINLGKGLRPRLDRLEFELRTRLDAEQHAILEQFRSSPQAASKQASEISLPAQSIAQPILGGDTIATVAVADPPPSENSGQLESGAVGKATEEQTTILESDKSESKDTPVSIAATAFNLSLSHPKRLAKGYSSSFVINVDSPTHGAGQKSIQLSSPTLGFSTSSIVQITTTSTPMHYSATPAYTCNPGNHALLISVRDLTTQAEQFSKLFHVQVTDYAIDHVSHPQLLAWLSIIAGICSSILWVLTFVGQIDRTWGIVAGATVTSAAVFFFYRLQSLYRTPSVTNNYTNQL